MVEESIIGGFGEYRSFFLNGRSELSIRVFGWLTVEGVKSYIALAFGDVLNFENSVVEERRVLYGGERSLLISYGFLAEDFVREFSRFFFLAFGGFWEFYSRAV